MYNKFNNKLHLKRQAILQGGLFKLLKGKYKFSCKNNKDISKVKASIKKKGLVHPLGLMIKKLEDLTLLIKKIKLKL